MKGQFLLLCLLISWPRQPGNKIDIYQKPLVDDLKLLWEEGVHTYDAYRKENFYLGAGILWTINDFSAYDVLSGCTVKGYHTFPVCAEGTSSMRLSNERKNCYMSHHKGLPKGHPYRNIKYEFDGNNEELIALDH